MRPTSNHIQATILRAVAALVDAGAGASATDRQKPTMIVEEIRSTGWASATFIGATHGLDLRLEGSAAVIAAAMQALEGLPDAEIPIVGHIVAEIAACAGPTHIIADNIIAKCLTVNVLTIED